MCETCFVYLSHALPWRKHYWYIRMILYFVTAGIITPVMQRVWAGLTAVVIWSRTMACTSLFRVTVNRRLKEPSICDPKLVLDWFPAALQLLPLIAFSLLSAKSSCTFQLKNKAKLLFLIPLSFHKRLYALMYMYYTNISIKNKRRTSSTSFCSLTHPCLHVSL